MSTSIFIAWRSGTPEQGEWSPVARLDRGGDGYRFVYTQGARMLAGFRPFPGLPDLGEVYWSNELFPMLANRLLSRSRPEYEAWLTWGGFDPHHSPEPLAVLSVTGGIRQTDALEVFPSPTPDAQGNYLTRFFLHGLRHAGPEVHERLVELKAGATLGLELEDDNIRDPRAVAVLFNDSLRMRLGYVPRYLARDARTLIEHAGIEAIDLQVARINPSAPLQMRMLCRLSAPWPAGFAPCTAPEFQPIVAGNAPENAAHVA